MNLLLTTREATAMTSSTPQIATLPALRAVTRSTLAALTVAGAVAFAPTATAGPMAFDSAIEITGSAVFDDASSEHDPSATGGSEASASAGVKSGGMDSTLFAVDADAGPTSAMFSLTDLGDNIGLGATGMMDDLDADKYKIGLNASFMVENTSAETYEIVLDIDFETSADADGFDAFANAELVVDSPLGTEIFASLQLSDTFFGDADSDTAGVPLMATGGFGEALADSGVETLLPPITITLVGAGSVTFDMGLTLLGNVFSDPGLSTSAAGGFISVESVTCTTCMTMPPGPAPVPAPGSLLLVALGLVGVGAARRRRQ